MIYLIITTSLHTSLWSSHPERREQEYKDSIRQTLQHLPVEIKPIIVENNGKRGTWLDHLDHHGSPVPVVYTENNKRLFRSKGVNELMDIQTAIYQHKIGVQDIVIKLTGRYHPRSRMFFDRVMAEQDSTDAWVKFFNVDTRQNEVYHCVLGMYALRAQFMMCWNPHTIEHYSSAEVAFARYVRFSGARLCEMDQLDLRCVFAVDGQVLDV